MGVKLVLAELLGALVPFDGGRGFAREAAEQLARLVQLDDARPEQEREDGRRVGCLLPQLVGDGLAGADALFRGLVGGGLGGKTCGGAGMMMVRELPCG